VYTYSYIFWLKDYTVDCMLKCILSSTLGLVGRENAVGIATCRRLDGPGIECRWEWDLPQPSRPALGPIQPPVKWVPGLFHKVKRPGRGVDHPPQSSAVWRKSKAIPLLPLWAFIACSRVNFTFGIRNIWNWLDNDLCYPKHAVMIHTS
jgi:hypothetical protein